MSLPAELALTGGGTLSVRPAAELTLLRGARRHYSHLPIRPGEETIAEFIGGNCLEIQASFALGAASQVGLYLLQAPGGVEQTCILYDSERQELAIDRRGASLDPATVRDVRSMPLRIARDAPLTLHVFVDGSVIEVFADDRVCLRSRVYPSRADSRALEPFARGGAAELISLDVWEMQSIWPPGGRPAIAAPSRA
jgi:beta-fructofuranosidase